MSNLVEKQPTSRPEASLNQWIYHAVGADASQIKFHRRGNNLHILYEGENYPDRLTLLHRFIPALQKTDINTFITASSPQIYQIQLYICQTGLPQPIWTATIYLNQLDSHLAQLEAEADSKSVAIDKRNASASKNTLPPFPSSGGSALALSNRSLARQGNETAIASYLSETLSRLGIAVCVSVKTIPFIANSAVYSTDIAASLTAKRLWIACDAIYSPEASLVGESITQQLRELEIEGYRDAIIVFQVAGEAQPDWLLRVDLTPPEEMLREWGRWGDVEAIQRLLNQAIAHLGCQFSGASLKEQTLHLICTKMPGLETGQSIAKDLPETAEFPEKPAILTEITPILEKIAPQGVHAAAIYGQITDRDRPEWLEWLNLPAGMHPALSESALNLAQQGDWEAIAFLLHRLLNPNLEQYLNTGGIRLKLLPKRDLLHIMSEAAVCPDQRQLSQTIARFLEPLKLPNLSGVRIYGRRAGQKQPMWSYGVDFVPRNRIVPEATPEFAASDAYVNELIARPGDPTLRHDPAPTDLHTLWSNFTQRCLHGLQKTLLRSRLFVGNDLNETSLALPDQNHQGMPVVMVWGAVGVLLVLQVNWLLEGALRVQPEPSTTAAPQTDPIAESPAPSPSPPASVVSSTSPIAEEEPTDFQIPELRLNQSANEDADAFNTGGFTEPTPNTPSPAASPSPAPSPLASPTPSAPAARSAPTSLPYTPHSPAVNLALAESLAAETDAPNFNSRQFNDKLSLYYRVLEESGTPDILVVGSSRALRGVDPIALEAALAELGYEDVSVFNFGVNGATAQVIELLLRQVLTPEQLPRLILWADGARAFNSNGEDVTYNGIAASPAYQELVQGTLVLPTVSQPGQPAESPIASADQGINVTLTDSYQSLDRSMSQQLARASGLYESRDRLKQQLQEGLTLLFPVSPPETTPASAVQPTQANLPSDYELVDAKGFLSLGLQFNPATYYQQYARVTGDYDRDYSNFRIPGAQQEALLSVLRYTQAQQIPIVFVNLPLTDEYLDPVRREYEQDFREYMVRLGLEQPGFTFRDLGRLWMTDYAYFSDPSHLNRYGAYAVSRHLAQDPLIPWNPSR
ncbi:DUF1574 domain-containing protein [filamentous cyanobacterium CCP2]|nr:DUF1574 domain-containing protein [filamentous cyanobacterium CCP2]